MIDEKLKFQPQAEKELVDFIQEQNSRLKMVIPIGGDTARYYGRMVLDEKLNEDYLTAPRVETRLFNKVIDYSPRDMVITVGAGMTLSELNTILADEKQRLPIEAGFPSTAQLGGIISANDYGPQALAYGTWRDYVLGMTVVTGKGELIQVGGKVVKNVAGYDVNKLMIGSLGQLGIITEVSLKVVSQQEETRRYTLIPDIQINDQKWFQFWKTLLSTKTLPIELFITSSTEIQPVISICFDGRRNEVDWKYRKLIEELDSFNFSCLKDEIIPEKIIFDEQYFTREEYSTISSTVWIFCKPLELMNLAIELKLLFEENSYWSFYAEATGRMRLDIPKDIPFPYQQIQALINKANGTLVFDNLLKNHAESVRVPVFFYEHPSLKSINRRVKQVFDPENILNRGRYMIW